MSIPVADLKKKLKTIKVDGKELYLHGDVLLAESQLEAYADGAVTGVPSADELIVMTKNGKVVRWKHGLTLTYSVDRSSFDGDMPGYAKVKAALASATRAWQETCGVRFEHVAARDTAANPAEGVVFVVRRYEANGDFLAAAFFPAENGDLRQVLIDPTFFTDNGFTSEGILRHELGHVLGFRHEHIRDAAAAAALGTESLDDTFDVTRFDGKSVMHYVNDTLGNPKLEITDLDRFGAQRIYGLPLTQVTFTD